jgi:hypothetical protein
VADVTGDGRADLVTANFGSSNVSVLLGNGNGTFASAQNFATGSSPVSAAVGDLNGDGLPDLVVANQANNTVSVLLGNRNVATHYQINAPASVTAGVPFSITVTAEPAGPGVDCLYTGTVSFSSSDLKAGLPANYTFTKLDMGRHTFTVTLKTAGSQTITATDTVTSSITATDSVTVKAAAASSFAVAAPPHVTQNKAFALSVMAMDAFGNVAKGYRGTVSFSDPSDQAAMPGNYTFTNTDQGHHRFSITLTVTGTQTITVTDTSDSGIKGSVTITVNKSGRARVDDFFASGGFDSDT